MKNTTIFKKRIAKFQTTPDHMRRLDLYGNWWYERRHAYGRSMRTKCIERIFFKIMSNERTVL